MLLPKTCLPVLAFAALLSTASALPELTPERLAGYLKQFPDADTNHDGILSREEAIAYYLQMGGQKAGKTAAPAAAEKKPTQEVAPTFADVHYGPYERNVLDFWQAKSDTPTPVVVYIHGGGFVNGDKSKVRGDAILRQCLGSGISFAAINYRYRTTAPIQDVLHDCARAIQYIRSQAEPWHLDKTRLAAYGGSAGAGTSLWLAFHDDLADPNNADPVLRESSRLTCAGAISTQFSYDILRWSDLFGPEVVARFADRSSEAPAFYGLQTDEELRGPVGQKLRAECDMYGLITRDDAPVFLSTVMRGGDVQDRGHYLHHPKHAEAIYKRCRELGISAIASLPALDIALPKDGPADLFAFLSAHLRTPALSAKAP